MPIWKIGVAALLGLSLNGCVLGRTIEQVIAHDRVNSYKVQTASLYWGGVIEFDVWNCQRTSAGFHCTIVDYDEMGNGFVPAAGALPPDGPPESVQPAEQPAPVEAPPAVPAVDPQPTETVPTPEGGG